MTEHCYIAQNHSSSGARGAWEGGRLPRGLRGGLPAPPWATAAAVGLVRPGGGMLLKNSSPDSKAALTEIRPQGVHG